MIVVRKMDHFVQNSTTGGVRVWRIVDQMLDLQVEKIAVVYHTIMMSTSKSCSWSRSWSWSWSRNRSVGAYRIVWYRTTIRSLISFSHSFQH